MFHNTCDIAGQGTVSSFAPKIVRFEYCIVLYYIVLYCIVLCCIVKQQFLLGINCSIFLYRK